MLRRIWPSASLALLTALALGWGLALEHRRAALEGQRRVLERAFREALESLRSLRSLRALRSGGLAGLDRWLPLFETPLRAQIALRGHLLALARGRARVSRCSVQLKGLGRGGHARARLRALFADFRGLLSFLRRLEGAPPVAVVRLVALQKAPQGIGAELEVELGCRLEPRP